jgi:hypothetical protein
MHMSDTDRIAIYRRYAGELEAMIDHLADMKELLVAAKLQAGLDQLRARTIARAEMIES